MAKFWPEKAECLKETSRESYKIDQDAMDFFYRNMFTLQLLCLAKAEVSVRKASKILGSHSHYIKDALNEGFLSERNGKLMVEDFATLKTFDLVKALRIVCDYQETVVDNPPSVVTFKNLSGNEVAQQMLREGMRDYYRLICRIENDPNLQGNIPIFTGGILGTIKSKTGV